MKPESQYVKQLAPGVVEVPGRRFPGAVIMGDTLGSIVRELEEAKITLKSAPDDAAETIDYVLARLRTLWVHYEDVLKENGIELPFS